MPSKNKAEPNIIGWIFHLEVNSQFCNISFLWRNLAMSYMHFRNLLYTPNIGRILILLYCVQLLFSLGLSW